MTFKEFDAYFDTVIGKLKTLGATKGKEYANGTNRFQNFLDIGREQDVDPKKVLWIYAEKHRRSIDAALKNGGVLSNESIYSRIEDLVLYLLLLHGMYADEATAKAVFDEPEIEDDEPRGVDLINPSTGVCRCGHTRSAHYAFGARACGVPSCNCLTFVLKEKR